MRTLFLLLLAANLLLFAAGRGLLGDLFPDGRESWRLARQIQPEALRLVNADGVASAVASAPTPTPQPTQPAQPSACLEFGGFAGDEVRRVDPMLKALNLGARLSTRKNDEQAAWIVYLPPFKVKADADRAAGELRRIGVSDFFIIQDNSPLRLAISLGVFKSDEAARARLTALSAQGVKNARVGQRATTIAKTWYQVRDVDAELLARLTEIRRFFLNQDIKDCPARAGNP